MAEKDKELLKQLNKKSDYTVKLDAFEGPLDLLLHLIKEAKVDIKDIFVSKITEQYLEYLVDIDKIDLEKASEFIDVAAQLLEIKSRALMPRIEDVLNDPEDPGRKLIQQIEEYKLFKEAIEKLKPLETVDRYYKAPDETVGDYRTVLKDMTLDGLLDAFSKLLTKAEIRRDTQGPRSIVLDRFTVAERIIVIRDIVQQNGKMAFNELFEDDFTKSEIITTFLAMLELLKTQLMRAVQESVFDTITLYSVEVNEDGN